MYLLPEEVRRRLLRRYRHRSREAVVDERFRGWAWHVPPVDPPYEYQLPLSEIVSRYCESMRDIYLRHVENRPRPRTAKMVQGALYHAVVAASIEHAKRTMYSMGDFTAQDVGAVLTQIRDDVIDGLIRRARPPQVTGRGGVFDRDHCRENMVWLWEYCVNQIVASVDRVRTAQPYIGLDALVNSAIPVVVEQKLDGRNLGLSGHLSADAYGVEGVVLDIKTGARRRFHRLATTGYALVIESIHEYPVDVGCIVYCWFKDKPPPTIEYDVHSIDEPLRQEFLELRDTAMRLIYSEKDPGLPPKCYEDCPYWEECH